MAGDVESSGAGSKTSGAALRPMEQGLKCPRCNSPNTKFCYYNNYSLSQPRHFCKSCRRYWTKGGALRNVPMGGGSRKNRKQHKAASAPSSSSRLLLADQYPISGFAEPGGASGLTFLGGLPPSSPAAGAVDFHIGLAAGASSRLLHAPAASGNGAFDVGYHEFLNLADAPHAALAAGCGYPISAYGEGNGGGVVSSIESLNSINQDLHWRLQQQRLAELCGGAEEHKENGEVCDHARRERACGSGSSPAAWTASFLENSCSFPTSSGITTNGTRRSGNINQSNWSGSMISAAWNDYLPQFSAIP